MSNRMLSRALAGTGLLAAVTLGACSETIAPPSGLQLSQAEVNEIAEAVSTDANDFVDASTFDGATGIDMAVTPFGAFAAGTAAYGAPCAPTKTPDQPANVDGDRVPDAVLFDFTGFDCTRGEIHVVMSGTLGIEDPAIPGFGIRLIFSNLSRTVSRGDASLTRTWNGTRQIVGSPSNPGTQLTHTITNFKTTFAFPGGATAEHTKNWNAMFVADVAGSIDYGARLPSGTWSFDGNSSWTRTLGDRSGSFSLQVSTTTPLHYNASCDVAPKFDAGVIDATVTRNGESVHIVIEHTACGQKTVTRS